MHYYWCDWVETALAMAVLPGSMYLLYHTYIRTPRPKAHTGLHVQAG